MRTVADLARQVEAAESYGGLPHEAAVRLFPALDVTGIPTGQLADALLEWSGPFPRAVEFLFTVVSEDEAQAAAVARSLLPHFAMWKYGGWNIGDVALRAWPLLSAWERDVLGELPDIEASGLPFTPFAAPEVSDVWPDERPLPAIASVEGVQARLGRRGYDAGPADGRFTDRTRRALWLFQVNNRHPAPSGQLDETTLGLLLDEP